MSDGFEQIRDLFTLIGGRAGLDLYATAGGEGVRVRGCTPVVFRRRVDRRISAGRIGSASGDAVPRYADLAPILHAEDAFLARACRPAPHIPSPSHPGGDAMWGSLSALELHDRHVAESFFQSHDRCEVPTLQALPQRGHHLRYGLGTIAHD